VRERTNVTLSQNHILNAGGWSVQTFNFPSPEFSLDFRNNYWGTSDPAQIEAWVRDGLDDPARPIVEYAPFSAVPLASSPQTMDGLKSRFHRRN
jgi:hypothetical protein